MSGESFTINSLPSLAAFHKYVEDQYAEHKYITFVPPRVGPDRSLSQNAIFHAWITLYIAFRLKKRKEDVTKGEIEGTKRIIKRRFTATHPGSHVWMVHKIVNIFSGESRNEYTSSASWKRGECYMVLTWFQMVAAEDGLILESKGEFAKGQQEENGE